MVNFDNAATTFPKPYSVRMAAAAALRDYGGNPGRSGHDISLAVSEQVYDAREKAAAFFGAEPENTVFTLNCTHALNFAVKGILKPGDHVIISSMEHNSVFRPVYALASKGVMYSIAPVSADSSITLKNIMREITHFTKAVVFTMGSNVTGQIMPFAEIGKLCAERGICFIADGAQACGVVPINIRKDNINFLCCAAHKGLYAAAGTGLLISDGKYRLRPIIEGGTGSASLDPDQPDILPDALESGTINTVGAISLSAGISFVKNTGISNIFAHESALCAIFISEMKKIKEVKIYRSDEAEYLPIVLFNIEGVLPERTAGFLNSRGYALRAGLHCAGLAHRTIGTLPDGAVRFAPSVFNTGDEAAGLCRVVAQAVRTL